VTLSKQKSDIFIKSMLESEKMSFNQSKVLSPEVKQKLNYNFCVVDNTTKKRSSSVIRLGTQKPDLKPKQIEAHILEIHALLSSSADSNSEQSAETIKLILEDVRNSVEWLNIQFYDVVSRVETMNGQFREFALDVLDRVNLLARYCGTAERLSEAEVVCDDQIDEIILLDKLDDCLDDLSKSKQLQYEYLNECST